MIKPSVLSIALALGCLGATAAQAQQEPPNEPATSQTEGTASDRTKPGETPTKGAMRDQQDPRQDPRPSTSDTEGTAADRTAPGKTPTTQNQAAQRGAQRSDIIGASVVTSANAPLGQVVDVVFDASNQPAFVVIESAGKATAVPYSVANSMKTADKIVIDQTRLQAAPKVKEGEWRSESGNWKKDAARYWERG